MPKANEKQLSVITLSEVTGFPSGADHKVLHPTDGHSCQSRLRLVVLLLVVRRHAQSGAVGSRMPQIRVGNTDTGASGQKQL